MTQGAFLYTGGPNVGTGIGLEQTLIPGLAFRGGSFSSSWGNGSGLEAGGNIWYRPPNGELSQGPFQTDLSHCQPTVSCLPTYLRL